MGIDLNIEADRLWKSDFNNCLLFKSKYWNYEGGPENSCTRTPLFQVKFLHLSITPSNMSFPILRTAFFTGFIIHVRLRGVNEYMIMYAYDPHTTTRSELLWY